MSDCNKHISSVVHDYSSGCAVSLVRCCLVSVYDVKLNKISIGDVEEKGVK